MISCLVALNRQQYFHLNFIHKNHTHVHYTEFSFVEKKLKYRGARVNDSSEKYIPVYYFK